MSDVLSLASVPVANVLASIPSPSVSYLQLGPFRVHFYALCILGFSPLEGGGWYP